MTALSDPPPQIEPPPAPSALILGAQPAIPDHVLQAALAFWREQRRIQWWQVKGRSMLPFLREGDELQVQHGSQDLRLGDIVLFCLQGQWVAHRIVHIQGAFPQRLITTKGDNAAAADPAVLESAIAGRGLAIRRGAGTIRLDTATRRVHGLMLVALARLVAGLRQLLRSTVGRGR